MENLKPNEITIGQIWVPREYANHFEKQRNDLRRALQICRGEAIRKEEQHQLVTSVLVEKVRKYEQEVMPKMQELFDRVVELEGKK